MRRVETYERTRLTVSRRASARYRRRAGAGAVVNSGARSRVPICGPRRERVVAMTNKRGLVIVGLVVLAAVIVVLVVVYTGGGDGGGGGGGGGGGY